MGAASNEIAKPHRIRSSDGVGGAGDDWAHRDHPATATLLQGRNHSLPTTVLVVGVQQCSSAAPHYDGAKSWESRVRLHEGHSR